MKNIETGAKNMKIEYKKDLSRLFGFIKPFFPNYLTGVFGMSLLGAAMAIVSAFLMGNIVEAAQSSNISLIITTSIILAATIVVEIFITPVFYFKQKKSIAKTMAEIRLKLLSHVQRLTIGYAETNHSGDLISRINNDTMVIESIYGQILQMIVSVVFISIGSIIFMLRLNWRLSLIFIFISLLMAAVNILFAKPLRVLSDRIQRQMGVITERLINLLSGFTVIRMFNAEKKVLEEYSTENNQLVQQELKRVNLFSFLEGTNYLLNMMNFAGLICIGSLAILDKQIDLGTLTSLVMLQMSVSEAFLGLGTIFPMMQGSLAGASRVFNIMDAEKERVNTTVGNPVNLMERDLVCFKDVEFEYIPGEPVLRNFSFQAIKDRMTAFVGPSGSGKTTIIKLLLGFYPTTRGDILIAGKSVSDYSLEELRDLIAYVPQEPYLFDYSIFRNIQDGKPGASEIEVFEAARAANAHDFIMDLADKYETQVGEAGAKLSGGQRQRISIARALLKDSPILLLDEATSSLDSESEKLIQEAIDNLSRKKTVLIIAHRLSTIRNADRIYVIERGLLVEEGCHQDLINKKGLYHYLYNL
ncbi:MAG: ABC transporter ATP-binding protein [Bacteroidales bacterium]|nr:ABC transporter ATP-binding protein [Bacteroidales bacterium]